MSAPAGGRSVKASVAGLDQPTLRIPAIVAALYEVVQCRERSAGRDFENSAALGCSTLATYSIKISVFARNYPAVQIHTSVFVNYAKLPFRRYTVDDTL